MTHRRIDVWLEDGAPRCEPLARACDRKFTCGRYLAPIGRSPLGDFSLAPDFPTPFWALECTDWVEIRRPPVAAPVVRPVRPPLGSDE